MLSMLSSEPNPITVVMNAAEKYVHNISNVSLVKTTPELTTSSSIFIHFYWLNAC